MAIGFLLFVSTIVAVVIWLFSRMILAEKQQAK